MINLLRNPLTRDYRELKEFILPRGSELCTRIHIIRTECRNAERDLVRLYEIESGGHGSAAYPYGDVLEKTLFWAKYHLNEDLSYCDSLLLTPSNASQFISTLECGNLPAYDVNGDGEIDQSDLIMLVVSIMNENNITDIGDFNFDTIIEIKWYRTIHYPTFVSKTTHSRHLI